VSTDRRWRAPLTTLFVLLLLVSLLPATAGATPGPSERSGDRIPDRLLVRFADGTPAAAVVAARRDVDAHEVSRIDPLGVHVWRVPAHASDRVLQALQRHPQVEFAELDAVVELEEVIPNDPEWYRQWGPVKVQAPTAWARTTGSSAVRIAILDTGVAPVDDLRDKLLPGRNIVAGNTDTNDDHGHGTMSAGVAAAATNNGVAVAGYCWDCRILPVKVMESSGTMSDLAAGIVWATDNGAHVISMSLSGASGTTTVQNAVRYARDRGVLLVAAAGNQGGTSPRYPAAYDEVIGVAGTDASDQLYSWSNHGSWVDVAAPGTNRTTTRTGGTINYGGTSSATPAVAGVLGLARATGASAAQARDALQRGATSMSSVRYGRIDALRTLELLGTTAPAPEPGPSPEPEPSPSPSPPPTPPPPVALVVHGSKVKGLVHAELRWSGASSSQVDVRVDGRVHVRVANSGRWGHDTGLRGSPTITYQVCEAGSSTVCSASVTVSSW
jgi:thermitase